MPQTMNGCGTWYYGKKNLQSYEGTCRSCGRVTALTSYDTGLYVVIVYIPIIPLGRKRIIEQCAACTRHVAMPLDEWRSAERRLADAVAAYRAAPHDKERAKEAIGACAGFRNLPAFLEVAPEVERNMAADAEPLRLLAAVHDVFGRPADAERVLRAALDADVDDDENQTREALADCLLRRGRPDEAEPYLSHVVEEGIPDRVDALYQLAQGYQLKGNHEKALEAFRHCEAINPLIVQDATFVRLRDESLRRQGTHVPVQPNKLVSRAKAAANFRKAMKVAPVVLALAAAGYAALSYVQGRRRSVHLVNGLHKPYAVRINGATHQLSPRTATEIRVAEGDVQVEILDAGAPVPAETVALRTPFLTRPFYSPTFVLNPDHAALLMKSRVYYTARSANDPGREPTVSYAGGKLLHLFEGIEHPFEAFPQSVTMDSKAQEAVRDGVRLVDEDEVPEALVLASALNDLGAEVVAEVAKRHALLEPERVEYLTPLAVAMERPDYIEFLRAGLDRRPLPIHWHRVYQNMMSHAGRDEEVEREYTAMLEKDPGNKDLFYLAGRAQRDTERAVALLREAAAGDKPCPYAFYALCFQHLGNAEFAEAAANAKKVLEMLPGDPDLRDLCKQALLANGDYDRLFEVSAVEQSGALPVALAAAKEEAVLRAALARAANGSERQKHSDLALQAEDLVRLRLSGYSPETIEAQAISIAAQKAYATGDVAEFARLLGQSADPSDQFLAQLTTGDAAGAAVTAAQVEPPASMHLMIHLVAARTGNREVAERQLKAAAEKLAKGDHEDRQFAAALDGTSPLSRSQIIRLRMTPRDKALVLTALGLRDPAGREEYFALARKLNFDRRFPYLLIDDVLRNPPAP